MCLDSEQETKKQSGSVSPVALVVEAGRSVGRTDMGLLLPGQLLSWGISWLGDPERHTLQPAPCRRCGAVLPVSTSAELLRSQ